MWFYASYIEVEDMSSAQMGGLPERRLDIFRTRREAEALREQYFTTIAAYIKTILPEGTQVEKDQYGARWIWKYEWDPYEHEYAFSCSMIVQMSSFEDQSVDYIREQYGKDVSTHYMDLLPFYVYREDTTVFSPVGFGAVDLFPDTPFEQNIKVVYDGIFKRPYICQRIGFDNPYIYENQNGRRLD